MKDSTVEQAGISRRICSLCKVQTEAILFWNIVSHGRDRMLKQGKSVRKKDRQRNSYILTSAFGIPFAYAAEGRESSQKYPVEKETS